MIPQAPPKTPRTAALTQSLGPGVPTYQRLLDALKLCQTLESQLETAGNTMNWQSDENARLRSHLERIRGWHGFAGFNAASETIDAAQMRQIARIALCRTCSGRGEIGGITASDPGGYSELCPDCQS